MLNETYEEWKKRNNIPTLKDEMSLEEFVALFKKRKAEYDALSPEEKEKWRKESDDYPGP